MQLAIGNVTHPAISVRDLRLDLLLGGVDASPAGALTVAGMTLLGHDVGPMRIRCGQLQWHSSALHCRDASATVDIPGLPPLRLEGDIRHGGEERTTVLDLHGSMGAQQVALDLSWSSARGGILQLSITDGSASWMTEAIPALAGWTLSGKADLHARITLEPMGDTGAGTLVINTSELDLSNPDGSIAAEALDVTAVLALQGDQQDQRGVLRLRGRQGLAYVDPVLVDLSTDPGELVASVTHRNGETTLEQLRIDQPGVLKAHGEAHVAWKDRTPVQRLRLEMEALELPKGYVSYLQPFLVGTLLDRLDTGGLARGSLLIRAGAPTDASLALSEVHITDQRGRFQVEGLDGQMHWTDDDRAPPSRIGWRAGQVYRLNAGGARLQVALSGDRLRLLMPVTLPLEDGALHLQHLAAEGLGKDDPSVTLQGRLDPIGLAALSRSMGWPELSGTLSGEIPLIRYQDRQLDLDGALRATVFDGTVSIPRLRIREPLGRLPQLTADIRLRQLDLEQITSTFSIGRITGGLDGDIDGLELLDWEPVAFDAMFRSSAEESTPRRISQRAIDTLSDVGGGGGALVSSTVLRLFEAFHYRDLGIGCALRDGVCTMRGVAPRGDGGYYLVRGAGVPRVDVIGFSREVDWSTLLEQLGAATRQSE